MGERGRERAEQRRVNLTATATLLQRGAPVGRYMVQDLSAGGALLTGGRDVAKAAPLRLLLKLPGGETLAVGAHVRRRARVGSMVALAVAFRHLTQSSEDRIQDAVVGYLDQRWRAAHPAVVVVEKEEATRLEIVARVTALGCRPISCAAPLDAIRVLGSSEPVGAVVSREGAGGCAALLTWVVENHPKLKPILLVEDHPSDPPEGHSEISRCAPEHLGSVLTAKNSYGRVKFN